ncbi:HK97 family phage prohead protease [Pontivivens nitratireducens]|uniref:HK97 family phage prohead protease n=1 Tax=Pontivivens nitratireducens TaxID=2758038 RepID=UPI00163AF7E0|nr:HK97 family phage prohead protease [Pontibrevibacter nitratireducens]
MHHAFLETKFATSDDGAISGVAWKFSMPDRIGDVIGKSAFDGVAVPLPMLFGHDGNDPIGVWEKAAPEGDELRLTGRLLVNDVPRAREVHALVKAGAVRGISIGFSIKGAEPRKGGGRTIKKLELLEASLVVIPMHPGAQVSSAKSAVRALQLAAALNRATAQISKELT